MAELWGYESAEDCIAHCVASEHYADPGTREKLLDIIREHGKFTNFEARITKRNGTIIWLQYSGTLFPEKGYFEGVATDITERKRAEEALKEYSERLEEMVEERTQELWDAQEQLVRKEKLAVLGQLAGGVGHELRNPLGVISNAIYFLRMTLAEADETTSEYLGIISSEVRTAEKIVSDLLDFSRTRMPEREEIAASELVAQALARQPPPEDVEVVTQIPSGLPPVYADPHQMGQVLGNLVANAYQAMPEGGQLIIKTSEVSGKPPRSEGVALSIADTGCGIPQKNLGNIFEPLFTTRAKGIGLGLAVSKSLMEANGGSIEVESEVGKGSTFTVTLPTKEVKA
jgi:PAS domain S-box-containing protein